MRRTVNSSSTGARYCTSPSSEIASTSSLDLDEKAGKLRQRDESRLMRVFLFLGMLCFVFLVAIVKLHHIPSQKKYRSVSVRRRKDEKQVKQQQQQHDSNLLTLPLNSIYRLEVENNQGQQESLSQYAGMVSLVVNVASEWGKTALSYTQLSQLQALYESRGFTVLAFPSNDFHQELDSNEKIQEFVSTNYPQATFPIFGLNSLNDNPVYQVAGRMLPNTRVKHNFYKYLVNREGVAVEFYTKAQEPLSMKEDIEELLNEASPRLKHVVE